MIRVKMPRKTITTHWLRQFPGNQPVWGDCRFLFDRDERDYDWLLVYDDLPPLAGPHPDRRLTQEVLACPARHTMLVTTEPSSIKSYGRAFTWQFGCVLTSQAEWALPHPDRIFQQPALHWFYGIGRDHWRDFNQMAGQPSLVKSHDLSMVFSPKSMRHTLHRRRADFMREMMRRLPEMAVFGRGARPLDDKAEALDDYRYHIAVENFVGPHHWTEKLADAFLGVTLPFYCGCPNATDYFPAESFIPIDIRDPAGALRSIRQAIADREYERRLPAILEARRRVLYDYNLFAVVAREIAKRHTPSSAETPPRVLYSRHALRQRGAGLLVRDLYDKARARLIHGWGMRG